MGNRVNGPISMLLHFLDTRQFQLDLIWAKDIWARMDIWARDIWAHGYLGQKDIWAIDIWARGHLGQKEARI